MFQVTSQILNHLFAQNSWAFRNLKPFAGKTVCIQLLPMSWVWSIQDDGSVLNVDNISQPNVTCVLSPLQLPRLMVRDVTVGAELNIQGESDLAEVLRLILTNVRWDVAEDLSRVTGDIAAERIVSTLQNLPKPPLPNMKLPAPSVLVSHAQFQSFGQQVSDLSVSIEALNQRLARLMEVSKA